MRCSKSSIKKGIYNFSPALFPVFVVKHSIKCSLDSNFLLFTWVMILLASTKVENLHSVVLIYLEVSFGGLLLFSCRDAFF